MEETFFGLSGHELELLAHALESSLRVRNRTQFFLWAQGALQGCLPHETLVCAHGDLSQQRLRHERFSRGVRGLKEDRLFDAALAEQLPQLVGDWSRSDGQPRLFAGRLPWLQASAPEHVAAHGPREIQGDAGSLFVFLGLPRAPGARDAYLLNLLMPHLHLALTRMLAFERPAGAASAAEPARRLPLTSRELQVLQWVRDGKTNQDIGSILNIRAPTVKNHMQKILRKLDVCNRAQAVGRADALDLFGPRASH